MDNDLVWHFDEADGPYENDTGVEEIKAGDVFPDSMTPEYIAFQAYTPQDLENDVEPQCSGKVLEKGRCFRAEEDYFTLDVLNISDVDEAIKSFEALTRWLKTRKNENCFMIGGD